MPASAFSPLSRGYGSWTGELKLDDGKKQPVPSLPSLCPQEHCHGVTVSARAKSAVSGFLPKDEGSLKSLPKTFVTRRGAIVLFAAPDNLKNIEMSDSDQRTLQQTKKRLLKHRHRVYSAKLGNTQTLTQSALMLGDEDYDRDAASLSDADPAPVLHFLRSLADDEVLDQHTKPGQSPQTYLRELVQRTLRPSSGPRSTLRLASALDWYLNENVVPDLSYPMSSEATARSRSPSRPPPSPAWSQYTDDGSISSARLPSGSNLGAVRLERLGSNLKSARFLGQHTIPEGDGKQGVPQDKAQPTRTGVLGRSGNSHQRAPGSGVNQALSQAGVNKLYKMSEQELHALMVGDGGQDPALGSGAVGGGQDLMVGSGALEHLVELQEGMDVALQRLQAEESEGHLQQLDSHGFQPSQQDGLDVMKNQQTYARSYTPQFTSSRHGLGQPWADGPSEGMVTLLSAEASRSVEATASPQTSGLVDMVVDTSGSGRDEGQMLNSLEMTSSEDEFHRVATSLPSRLSHMAASHADGFGGDFPLSTDAELELEPDSEAHELGSNNEDFPMFYGSSLLAGRSATFSFASSTADNVALDDVVIDRTLALETVQDMESLIASREPSRPASRDPSRPASREPSRPASREPSRPASREPSRLASRDPSRPASGELSRLSSRLSQRGTAAENEAYLIQDASRKSSASGQGGERSGTPGERSGTPGRRGIPREVGESVVSPDQAERSASSHSGIQDGGVGDVVHTSTGWMDGQTSHTQDDASEEAVEDEAPRPVSRATITSTYNNRPSSVAEQRKAGQNQESPLNASTATHTEQRETSPALEPQEGEAQESQEEMDMVVAKETEELGTVGAEETEERSARETGDWEEEAAKDAEAVAPAARRPVLSHPGEIRSSGQEEMSSKEAFLREVLGHSTTTEEEEKEGTVDEERKRREQEEEGEKEGEQEEENQEKPQVKQPIQEQQPKQEQQLKQQQPPKQEQEPKQEQASFQPKTQSKLVAKVAAETTKDRKPSGLSSRESKKKQVQEETKKEVEKQEEGKINMKREEKAAGEKAAGEEAAGEKAAGAKAAGEKKGEQKPELETQQIFEPGNLLNNTQAEIAKLLGRPVSRAEGKKVGGDGKKAQNKKVKIKEPNKKTKEELELEALERQVTEAFDEQPPVTAEGLSAEEMEIQRQILEAKISSAQEKLEGKTSTKKSKEGPSKPQSARGKSAKNKKDKEEEDKLALELAAKKEARQLEKQKREEEQQELKEAKKKKEEEKQKALLEAEKERKKVEREVSDMRRAAEEQELVEQDARARLAEANKAAREEREQRRKEEQQRRRQEAQEKRQSQREAEEAARRREVEMLMQIADKEEQKKLAEEERERKAEQKRREEEEEEEEERLAELKAKEQEERIIELETQAQEEALKQLQDEREELSRRARERDRIAQQKIEQEEKLRLAYEEEVKRMQEEQERLAEMERQRLEEERRRLMELQKKEQEARELMQQEIQKRREALQFRMDHNARQRVVLGSLRFRQGFTRPWIYSYFLNWPRETYERPIGGESEKKRPPPKKK